MNSLVVKLDEYRKKLVEQKRTNDARQYITESNIAMIEGDQAIEANTYHKARECYEISLEATIIHTNYVLKNFSEHSRIEELPKAKKVLSRIYQNIYFAYILENGHQFEHLSLQEIKNTISKDKHLKGKRSHTLGDKDYEECIEYAVFRIVTSERLNFPNIKTEDFQNIPSVAKSSIEARMAVISLNDIVRKPYGNDIEESKERSRLLKIIMTEAKRLDNWEKYYKVGIDYYISRCQASETLSIFNDRYVNFQNFIDEYTDHFRASRAVDYRKIMLDTATVLISKLNLTKGLDDKITILGKIEDLYGKTRVGNSYRFRVILEWHILARKVLNLRSINEKNIHEIINNPKLIQSLKYVDRDEDFLATYLKSVIESRATIKIVKEYLEFILNPKNDNAYFESNILTAAGMLLKENVITKDHALEILKKYIERVIEIASSLPIQFYNYANSSDQLLSIINKGESENVEFKSTWAYDLDSKGKNLKLSDGICETIAAFMNSEGGTIFIGVDNQKKIIDLRETEGKIIRKGSDLEDELRKQMDDVIGRRLGNDVHILKSIRFELVEDKLIAIINVKRSKSEVFVDNEYLYIRRAASNKSLTVPEFLQYSINRRS